MQRWQQCVGRLSRVDATQRAPQPHGLPMGSALTWITVDPRQR